MCSGCCPVNGVCAPECHCVVSDSALRGCAAVQVSPAPATPDPQAVAAAADAVAGTGGLVAAAAGGAILQLHTCIVHAQLSTCMAQLSCVLCVSCQAVSTVTPPPCVCVWHLLFVASQRTAYLTFHNPNEAGSTASAVTYGMLCAYTCLTSSFYPALGACCCSRQRRQRCQQLRQLPSAAAGAAGGPCEAADRGAAGPGGYEPLPWECVRAVLEDKAVCKVRSCLWQNYIGAFGPREAAG